MTNRLKHSRWAGLSPLGAIMTPHKIIVNGDKLLGVRCIDRPTIGVKAGTSTPVCYLRGTRVRTPIESVEFNTSGSVILSSHCRVRASRSNGSAASSSRRALNSGRVTSSPFGSAVLRLTSGRRSGTCTSRRTTPFTSTGCWYPRSIWSMERPLCSVRPKVRMSLTTCTLSCLHDVIYAEGATASSARYARPVISSTTSMSTTGCIQMRSKSPIQHVRHSFGGKSRLEQAIKPLRRLAEPWIDTRTRRDTIRDRLAARARELVIAC